MTDRKAIEILTEEYRHVAIHLKDADKSPEYYKEMQDLAHALTRGIEALNQRTPPRPQGEWVHNRSKRSYRRMCTNCYNISYFCGDGDYPNCPYCGANMRKGGKK